MASNAYPRQPPCLAPRVGINVEDLFECPNRLVNFLLFFCFSGCLLLKGPHRPRYKRVRAASQKHTGQKNHITLKTRTRREFIATSIQPNNSTARQRPSLTSSAQQRSRAINCFSAKLSHTFQSQPVGVGPLAASHASLTREQQTLQARTMVVCTRSMTAGANKPSKPKVKFTMRRMRRSVRVKQERSPSPAPLKWKGTRIRFTMKNGKPIRCEVVG